MNMDKIKAYLTRTEKARYIFSQKSIKTIDMDKTIADRLLSTLTEVQRNVRNRSMNLYRIDHRFDRRRPIVVGSVLSVIFSATAANVPTWLSWYPAKLQNPTIPSREL